MRTFASQGSEVDLSEIAALLRLYELASGIGILYSPGASITILSNGIRYSDVFCEPETNTINYRKNVQKIIEFFGLKNVIKLVPEETMYHDDLNIKIDENHTIFRMLIKHKDTHTITAYHNLWYDILLNIHSPERLTPSEMAGVVLNICGDDTIALGNDQRTVKDFILNNIEHAIIHYIAVNRSFQECRIFEENFPDSIKLTVHPKINQIGIYPMNNFSNVFPHNGQAVVNNCEGKLNIDDISIDYAANILRHNRPMTGVVLSPENYPFSNGEHPLYIYTSN